MVPFELSSQDTVTIVSSANSTASDGLVRRGTQARQLPRAIRTSAAIIEVDRPALTRFAQAGGGLLSDFPLGPSLTASLSLVPITPFQDDAVLEIAHARGQASDLRPLRTDGVYLRGAIAGLADSQAFLSVSDAGTFGFVRWQGRTAIISSGRKSDGLPTVVYELAALPPGFVETPPWACGTADSSELPSGADGAGEGGVAGTPCRQVRIAFETDYEFFVLLDNDVTVATDYVATVSAALNTIFDRDLSVRLSTSYLRLWPEVEDVWTAGTTSAQLVEFRSVWGSQGAVARDTAHMLSGRNLGGGIAYAPGLCSSFGYGVSANLAGFFPTPLTNNGAQNWDIFVVAHEVGHNFGMPHTHAMSPPVDGCGSTPADCSAADADSGTLMSYCHLCAGGLSNIRLEFHPASIALAQSYLDGLACNFTGAALPPVGVADASDAFVAVPVLLDVLANEEEVNCDALVISAFDATSARGASITRSVGTGAGGRDELLYTMPTGGLLGSDSFQYTVRDGSGLTASTSVSLSVSALRAPENPMGATSQIDAAYFSITTEVALPNYDLRTPYAVGTVGQVNFLQTFASFATSGRSDLVGARFRGWLSIPTSGNWTLFTNSDEGSRLSIGDTVVVSNDGVHGMQERSGTIALAAGLHAITIDYFERTGAAGLVVSWQGSDGAKQVIPPSQYFRGGNNIPEDLTNDGRVNALDIAVLLSSWGQSNSPYDLTGDGLVNAQDLTMILFAWGD